MVDKALDENMYYFCNIFANFIIGMMQLLWNQSLITMMDNFVHWKLS